MTYRGRAWEKWVSWLVDRRNDTTAEVRNADSIYFTTVAGLPTCWRPDTAPWSSPLPCHTTLRNKQQRGQRFGRSCLVREVFVHHEGKVLHDMSLRVQLGYYLKLLSGHEREIADSINWGCRDASCISCYKCRRDASLFFRNLQSAKDLFDSKGNVCGCVLCKWLVWMWSIL